MPGKTFSGRRPTPRSRQAFVHSFSSPAKVRKGKFFSMQELSGGPHRRRRHIFAGGDAAVFGLTPVSVLQVLAAIAIACAPGEGGGRLASSSAYQIMALAAIPCAAGICLLQDLPAVRPDRSIGLRLLWSPGIILSMSTPLDRHLPLYGAQAGYRRPDFLPCSPRSYLNPFLLNRTGPYEPKQSVRRRYQCIAG